MTAPTPDLDLDAIYREMESNPRDPMEERIGRRKILDALAAATADRDDARRELAEQKRINASNLRVMTEQLELARQKLADAPHSYYCGTVIGNACRCWKAGL